MAQLFSQYTSGVQLTAGAIAGSVNGASGLNPIVDRLNSITSNDSVLSGTALTAFISGGQIGATPASANDIANKSYVDAAVLNVSFSDTSTNFFITPPANPAL